MITDIVHTYGIFAHKLCLSVLGAAQVDKYGNLNSTRLSEDFYLTGSGGANDGVAASTETVVVLAQSKKRFVNELPYTTCFGKNITSVISDKGIFEKTGPDNELMLTAYFPEPGKSDQSGTVRGIIEDCGWALQVHPNLREIETPNAKELALLRVLSSKAG
jgi:acyl CoA:acetate/3-ketoacid CoA transferase beta subunit